LDVDPESSLPCAGYIGDHNGIHGVQTGDANNPEDGPDSKGREVLGTGRNYQTEGGKGLGRKIVMSGYYYYWPGYE
jgi:hypothetical protein